jgi:hypothetical protein
MKFARNLLYRIAVIVVIVEMVFGPLVPVADIAIAQAASIPTILSYQGRLTDASGSLLGGSGTNYYFKFSLWSSATIGSGTKLWPTAAPSSFASVVKQGVFNVNIGDTANGYPDSLDYNFANASNLYLQVEVSSDNSSFETLSPRQLVSSAAFSQVSGAVSGVNASSFGTTSQLSNSVVSIVSTTSTAVGLTVRGAASQASNIFNIQDYLGGNLLSVTASGGLQVSTLANCDTIDTDANGNFVCGTDNGSTWATSSDSLAFDTRLAATTTLNNITTLQGLNNLTTANATITNLTLGTDYITDLTGSGLSVVNGALTSLGDGTFSTTSADYWETFQNRWGTTSVAYWDALQNRWSTTSNDYYLTTKSTTDLAEGSNLYWTDNRFDARLSATTSLPNLNTLGGLATIGSTSGTSTFFGGSIFNGNVGIGTNSPSARLSVAGDSYLGGNLTATGTLTVLGGATSTISGGLTVGDTNFVVDNTAGSINLFSATNPYASFGYKFYMNGTSAWNGNFFVAGTNRIYVPTIGSNATPYDFTIDSGTNKNILFKPNAASFEAMRITSTGNVGIGTTSPYQKLSVAGNVIADTFIATSTTATSTFPLLSTNALSLNGTYVTSFWATSSDALAFDTRLAATTTLNNINNLGGLATITTTKRS